MALGEHAFFAHVEHGDFAAVVQHAFEILRGDAARATRAGGFFQCFQTELLQDGPGHIAAAAILRNGEELG